MATSYLAILDILTFRAAIRNYLLYPLAVPETKGRGMAESAEDAESLVEQFRFFQWNTWDTAASASGGEASDTQTQTSRV